MEIKLVYCLTSSGGDLYEAMTRVSLATVRLTNPSAHIEIACDEQSYQALQASDSHLFREADAVHGFPTPEGPPTFRNRFVKTQLRLLLSGPFLFLDSDTVVRKPLSALQHVHGDLAAAPNHSADSLSEQIWCEDQANLDAMGWSIREPYVNGGVIWYQDTPGAHRFAQAWHRNWLANVERTRRLRDQPALNYSLVETNAQMAVLDHCWNAQVEIAPKKAKDANVWHMYLGSHPETIFEFERLVKRGLVNNTWFSPDTIAKVLVSKHHPWCSRSFVDDLLATRIVRFNHMSLNTRLWLGSTPLQFLTVKAKTTAHQLRKRLNQQ